MKYIKTKTYSAIEIVLSQTSIKTLKLSKLTTYDHSDQHQENEQL